jgi:hypothetical protein
MSAPPEEELDGRCDDDDDDDDDDEENAVDDAESALYRLSAFEDGVSGAGELASVAWALAVGAVGPPAAAVAAC